MTAPGWVLALALLLWGWQVGVLWIAGPFAVAVAVPVWTRHRVALGPTEFNRAVEICWVLALGGLLLVYSRLTVGNVLREFVQWLPVFCFPALLSQVWSEAGRLPTSSLLPYPRWRRLPHAQPSVDASPAFAALCLLSASAAGAGRILFFPAAVVVLGCLLWAGRSRVAAPFRFVLMFTVAVGVGWGVSRGLAEFQPWIENRVLEWTSRLDRDRGTGRMTRTAVGQPGTVRLSNRVLFTVRDVGPRPMPARLRVAGYSVWREGTWMAPLGRYEKIEGAGDEWVLDERPERSGAAEVEWVRSSTGGLLPLPGTTRALKDLPADSVERTRLGTVRVDAKGGMVAYRAELGTDAAWEAEPAEEDGEGVPTAERAAVEAVVGELGLRGRPVGEVLEAMDRYFVRRFRYTLDIRDPPAADPRAVTAIGRFLLGHREGHCEYFATAAVLMLRSAGVPARYVTGYLLSPGDRQGGVYRVRESNAHAWVRVWRDGVWVDYDPTPPSDLGEEEAAAARGWWGRFSLRLQSIRFAMTRWWWLGEKRLLRQAYWLAVPLLVGLLWRFRGVRRRALAGAGHDGARAWPGMDSEWLPGLELLEAAGWARKEGELFEAWRERIRGQGCPEPVLATLGEVQALHERLRFDPRGLDAGERTALRTGATETLVWLRGAVGRASPVR